MTMVLKMRKILNPRMLILVLLPLFVAAPAFSQPVLDIRHINEYRGRVELYFTVKCNGQSEYGFWIDHIVVTDDGVEKEFSLWHPKLDVAPPISVALVFEASSGMAGPKLAGVKAGANAFVDMMVDTTFEIMDDEAVVVSVDNEVHSENYPTSWKSELRSEINAILPSGLAPLWDGVYAGLNRVNRFYPRSSSAVIVVTDGVDRVFERTYLEVAALAKKHRIPIHIIGLDSTASMAEPRYVAAESGGEYYPVQSPDSLVITFQKIFARLKVQPDESFAWYYNGCKDGNQRTVELRVNDLCGGSDVKSTTYRAEMDSSSFSPLQLSFGDATAQGGKDFTIPLQLLTSLDNVRFHPFTFKLLYDTSLMLLKDVTAPPSSLLYGLPISFIPETGGVRVGVLDSRVLNGTGLLLHCRFSARNPATEENLYVAAEDFRFDAGCLLPMVESGEVVIQPHIAAPTVSCDMDGPRTLRWNRISGDYDPNPISVVLRSYNTGDAAAMNSHARISFDTSVFILSSPQVMEQPGTPRDLAPNAFNSVIWQLYAKSRSVPDSSRICIEMTYDNHPKQNCCIQVYVPARDGALSCAVSIPPIVLDTVAGSISPMPFDVTVTGWNESTTPTDTVRATIYFPPELRFATPDTPGSATKLLSNPLLPVGQHGTASWRLWHEPSTTDRTYLVTVKLSSGTDSTECSAQVRIPRQQQDFFSFDLTAEGPIEFCNGGSVTLDAGAGYASYLWNTGSVARRIIVTGSGDYNCHVTDITGNKGISTSLRVTEHPYPKVGIIQIGPNPRCEGDTLLLRVEHPGGYRYLWSTGATENEILVTAGGSYQVGVYGPGDCEGRDTAVIVFHPNPVKPVITRTGDSLHVPNFVGNIRWYRDGRVLVTSFTNSLKLPTPGTYVARYTTPATGCSTDSDPLVITVLSAEVMPGESGFTLHAYPDPADDVLNIEVHDASGEYVRIVLTDALGRSETVFSGHTSEAGVTLAVSLHGRALGPLFIQLWHGGGMLFRKVMRK